MGHELTEVGRRGNRAVVRSHVRRWEMVRIWIIMMGCRRSSQTGNNSPTMTYFQHSGLSPPTPFYPSKKHGSDCNTQPFSYLLTLHQTWSVFACTHFHSLWKMNTWCGYQGYKCSKCICIFSYSLPFCISVIICPHIHGSSFGGCFGLSIELLCRTGTASGPVTSLWLTLEVQSLQRGLFEGKADGEGCGEQAIFHFYTRSLRVQTHFIWILPVTARVPRPVLPPQAYSCEP